MYLDLVEDAKPVFITTLEYMDARVDCVLMCYTFLFLGSYHVFCLTCLYSDFQYDAFAVVPGGDDLSWKRCGDKDNGKRERCFLKICRVDCY